MTVRSNCLFGDTLAPTIKCIYDKWHMSYGPAKRELNLRKHGIDLAECDGVFDEPMLTRDDDREAYGEQRLISLGWLKSRVIVLVWTDRADEPHLISCREAEAHEQEAYLRAHPKG